jgi:hypothetical protein
MRTLSAAKWRWMIVALMNITIAAMILYQQKTGQISPTVALISSWASFVLLNLVFVVGLFVREHQSGKSLPGRFAVGVALVALSCGVLTTFSLKIVRPKNRYAQLALSNTPLSSIKPERDRLIVELIRKRAAESKQYNAAAAQMAPIVPPLYSAASFDSVEAMNKTASRLQSAFEIDREYGANLKADRDGFRTRMAQVDPTYLRSWNKDRKGDDDLEDRIMDLESRWVQSVSTLYAFAVLHKEDIAVRGEKLEIRDPKVKREFEQMMTSSEKLQSELNAERSIALAHQRRAAANSGIKQDSF